MIEELQSIRLQLHDAPSEVKQSYNQIVEYFGVTGAIKGWVTSKIDGARLGSLKQDMDKINKKISKLKEDKLNPAREELEKLKKQKSKIQEEINKIKSKYR